MIQKIFMCAMVSFMLLSPALHAQTPRWEWGVAGGGNQSEHGVKIVSDGSGGMYVLGTFRDSATFGGNFLKSFGGRDVFIARYSHIGECIWAKRMGSAADDDASAIAVSSDGVAYVAGSFVGTINFPFTSPELTGIMQIHGPDHRVSFMAEYEPDGFVGATNYIRSSGINEPGGLSFDAQGNLYLAGSFTGAIGTGQYAVESIGERDIFMITFGPGGLRGTHQLCIGGTGDDRVTSIATDRTGRIYIAGSFTDSLQLGTTMLRAGSDTAGFVAAFDTDSTLAWARTWYTQNLSGPVRVAADPTGNIYLTGAFRDELRFGATTLTSQGEDDMFLASYAHDGNTRWIQQIGGSLVQMPSDIITDAAGNVYVTAYSRNLPDGTIFAARYAGDGAQVWLKSDTHQGVTFNAGAHSSGIGTDLQGNVYITGDFSGEMAFGSTVLHSAGSTSTSADGSDIFIAKLTKTSDAGLAATEYGMRVLGSAPNPCTTETMFRFELDEPADMRLLMSDIQGRVVRSMELEHLERGLHSIPLNTADLPQGYYILQCHVHGKVSTQAIEVIR